MDAQPSQAGSGHDHAKRATDLVSELVQVESTDAPWPGTGDDVIRLAERYGAESALAQLALAETLDRLLISAGQTGKTVTGTLLNGVIGGYQHALASAAQVAGEGRLGMLSDHVSRLAALRRINQAATASLDLDSMMQTVVRVVRDTMGCQSCSIFLLDDGNAMLVLSASVGLDPQGIGRVYLPVGTGITGKAAQTRQLMAVSDASTHPAYIDYPQMGDQSYSSQVSVPLALRSPDRLVGVL
ncbi:MAG TPA: GAF domain-containing protein, partial [Nitrolancea sp.]|nr:GAF domain-containing protein [Nitrolancea sp.]